MTRKEVEFLRKIVGVWTEIRWAYSETGGIIHDFWGQLSGDQNILRQGLMLVDKLVISFRLERTSQYVAEIDEGINHLPPSNCDERHHPYWINEVTLSEADLKQG